MSVPIVYPLELDDCRHVMKDFNTTLIPANCGVHEELRAHFLWRAGQRLQIREGSSILEASKLSVANAALRSFAPKKNLCLTKLPTEARKAL